MLIETLPRLKQIILTGETPTPEAGRHTAIDDVDARGVKEDLPAVDVNQDVLGVVNTDDVTGGP